MPISFRCSSCTQTLKVSDALAGSKGKCPKCGAVLRVPAAKKTTDAPARSPTGKARPPEPAIIEERALPPRPRPAAKSEDDNETPETSAPRLRSVRKNKKRKSSSRLLYALIGGAVGLLLTCSGAGVVVWLYFWPSSSNSDDFTYLPNNCQMIASLRMEQLMSSEAFQELRREIPEIADKLKEDKNNSLGLGIEDVDRMLVGNGPGAKDAVFVLRTKKAIDAAQLRSQNPNVKYAERKIGKYRLQEPQDGFTEAFCVLDKKRVVLGEKMLLGTVLMRDKRPEFSNNLQEAMNRTDFSNTIAFIMDAQSGRSHFGGAIGPFGAKNNIFGAIQKINGIAAQATIGAEVRLEMTLLCQDAAGANDVKKRIDGILGVFRNKDARKEINDMLEWDLKIDVNKVTTSKTFKVGPLIEAYKQQNQLALPPEAFQGAPGLPELWDQQPKALPQPASPGKRQPRRSKQAK